jgi:predicted lipid carrier protein YhbT
LIQVSAPDAAARLNDPTAPVEHDGSDTMTDDPLEDPGTNAPGDLRSIVARRFLRAVPPPERLAAPLRLLPPSLLNRGSQVLVDAVLTGPLASGSLDYLEGRRVGVEVVDLELRWVIAIDGRRVSVLEPGAAAEATVRGSATDLLLLASRLEDADTLFFQRRLQLTGDVVLGLMVRNMLDQLPWESMPLALRIGLNRGARLARAAREARMAGERGAKA